MNNTYLSMDFNYLVEGLRGDTMIKVSNMSRRRVLYIIPEISVEREFREFIEGQAPDTKSIPFGELYALNNLSGGRQIIWDNLKIDSNAARIALELPVEESTPEVGYTREEVRKVLESGTEDEVLDMIEFGPYYIAEWVKEDILTLDSFNRRDFIGKLFKINVETVAGHLKWASEDPNVQGYAGMKGASKAASNRAGATRRAGVQIQDGKAEPLGTDIADTGRRRRA